MNYKVVIKFFFLTSAFGFSAQAQESVGSEIDSEIDQVYSQSLSGGEDSVEIIEAPAPRTGGRLGRVQKQPVTYVEATPLQESRAEKMRKARQDAELHTETKIVEKLEHSRMEDEKRRANVLFGNKFDSLNEKEATQPAPQNQPPPPPPQPIQIQVVPAPAETTSTKDIVEEEVRAALSEEKALPEQPIENRYLGANLGIAEYPDVKNVTSNYALGFTFGTRFEDAYSVEGSFLYADYELENSSPFGYVSYLPRFQNVKQYAGVLGVKYHFFTGIVRPAVGGVLVYSYRTYTLSEKSNTVWEQNLQRDSNSHAVDLGMSVGVDFEFSKRAVLGAEVKYLFNVYNRVSETGLTPPGTTSLEKLNYVVMGLVGKFYF